MSSRVDDLSLRRATPADAPQVAELAAEGFATYSAFAPWWGSGLAGRLMAAAVDAAARYGFARMRLWTPADHGRTRRFYEREGWTAPGEPVHDPVFGMATIEYVRDVG